MRVKRAMEGSIYSWPRAWTPQRQWQLVYRGPGWRLASSAATGGVTTRFGRRLGALHVRGAWTTRPANPEGQVGSWVVRATGPPAMVGACLHAKSSRRSRGPREGVGHQTHGHGSWTARGCTGSSQSTSLACSACCHQWATGGQTMSRGSVSVQ